MLKFSSVIEWFLYISFNGKTHTMSEWSKITGVAQYNIYNRLQDNWTVKDALTKKEHKYRQRKWNFENGLYQHKPEKEEV